MGEELRVSWHSFDSREPIIALPTSGILLSMLVSSHGPQGGGLYGGDGSGAGGNTVNGEIAAGWTLLLACLWDWQKQGSQRRVK